MKRRFLLVSAMILLLGSQVDMFAQKKGGPDFKKPGMEMRECKKPGKHMNGKDISQGDIKKLQDFYWAKYRVRLSKDEAKKILMAEMKCNCDHKHRPDPRGPQKPPRR